MSELAVGERVWIMGMSGYREVEVIGFPNWSTLDCFQWRGTWRNETGTELVSNAYKIPDGAMRLAAELRDTADMFNRQADRLEQEAVVKDYLTTEPEATNA